ncbi:MAG: hypothetical protein ACPLN0_01155 [Candidatus Hydrothermia bacterium]
MNIWLCLLMFQNLNFARNLEQEGDYFRAVYEYKREYYSESDPYRKDSIASRISFLSVKIGDLQTAERYASKISDEEAKSIDLAMVLVLQGRYEEAKFLLSGNDTLLAWLYLRQGKLGEVKKLFPDFSYNSKSPALAGLLSTIIPGLGKFYTGRAFDGFSSLVINGSTFYSFYRAFRQERKVESYIYGFLSVVFYAGNIYGSVVSARERNDFERERLVKIFETKYNIWRFWR